MTGQASKRLDIGRSLPVIPLWVYRAIARVNGGYPESALLSWSARIGKPDRPRCARQYWRDFEQYRSPASICDYTGIALWRTLDRLTPSVVVEFGTGFSTLVMTAWASHYSRPMRVLSFEHDPHWFRMQSKVIADLGISDYVRLIESPLTKQNYFGRSVSNYSGVAAALDTLGGKAELFFVDGPPAERYGGPGRRGSILQAIALAKAGGTILVHDALRADEFTSLVEYCDDPLLQFHCRGIAPVWYGLAFCERRPTQVCSI